MPPKHRTICLHRERQNPRGTCAHRDTENALFAPLSLCMSDGEVVGASSANPQCLTAHFHTVGAILQLSPFLREALRKARRCAEPASPPNSFPGGLPTPEKMLLFLRRQGEMHPSLPARRGPRQAGKNEHACKSIWITLQFVLTLVQQPITSQPIPYGAIKGVATCTH